MFSETSVNYTPYDKHTEAFFLWNDSFLRAFNFFLVQFTRDYTQTMETGC